MPNKNNNKIILEPNYGQIIWLLVWAGLSVDQAFDQVWALYKRWNK